MRIVVTAITVDSALAHRLLAHKEFFIQHLHKHIITFVLM